MRVLLLFFIVVSLLGCSKEKPTLFRLISPEQSGLTFQNTVEEKDTINILNVQYMYHGGGVAIGDFNNDSLPDVFFTGNMVGNALYLNQGNLKFKDISRDAGIEAPDKWKSGVALADVNADGWLDIYVCATISDDPARRANMLFIHQGLDANGIPHFKDEATAYGVADTGYSQNAVFFDYDKDGDLDLFVLTNLESDKIPSNYRPRIVDGTALNNDHLYRNNGNNTFTEVTKEAGILIEGYGLGIAIADINNDSWPDIYIGNDYISNDILYINNQDGTFTNQIASRLNHQSLFSMGIDVADVNNDALNDIITLDMLPENNLRRKTMSGAGATYVSYINNKEYGYEYQYMRNMLHVNNGDGTFREVGQMAGIHQTEWSWSSLLVDVDNDGQRDLLVTNGFLKDITDKDYVMFKRETGGFSSQRALIDSIPVLKVPNYVYKNNGDLTFKDKTKEWGMLIPSFSNGAAFADLDRDGDLDYVINNINDPAFLYENTLYTAGSPMSSSKYLRVKLKGPEKNPSGLGVKVTIRYDSGAVQFHDHSIYRGYLSTVEDIVHFGVSNNAMIDTVHVEWPDGKTQTLYHVPSNQVLTVQYTAATTPVETKQQPTSQWVKDINATVKVDYKHKEWDKIDFYKQRTLPHKFSQAGPGLAVGDINGDNLEDFIVGGSSSYDESIFLQQKDGTFAHQLLPKGAHNKSEDEGLLLFDADNDGDLDLYIVGGSYEGEPDESRYEDRFYRNAGNGKFVIEPDALPSTLASGSCVRAADMDADGDLDLFVAGRVIAGAYPVAPESYILKNENGKFKNVTEVVAPALKNAGMITDALWTDYNNDGKPDLVVVGEFMSITFFTNTGKTFTKAEKTGLENFSGWWNSIVAADFDKDGDTDYVIGNLGLNNYYQATAQQPLRIYAKDLDANGSIDAILSCYFKSEEGTMVEYPVHFWEELIGQSPKFRKQFSRYKKYGSTTLEGLLKPYDQTDMLKLTANYMQTSYAENKGDGTFVLKALPALAQVSPVNGMLTTDVNDDGHLDIVMIGNDYGNEVFAGRYDAATGLILFGDGHNNFTEVPSITSGFWVRGDAKALASLRQATGEEMWIATQNLDSLRIFTRTEKSRNTVFRPQRLDTFTEIYFADGSKQKVEFYYGAGYLSQSTRTISVPATASKIIVYDSQGKSRTIDYNQVSLLKSPIAKQ